MEPDFEKAHQRRIQSVDPQHRLVGIIDMFMPRPTRIGQEIALFHFESFAVDDTLRAFALDNESYTSLRVPMRHGMLSRLKHLDIELERVCCRPFVRTAQANDTPRNHL